MKCSEGRNFRAFDAPLNLRSAGLSAFAYEPAGMILTPTGVWLPHLALKALEF